MDRKKFLLRQGCAASLFLLGFATSVPAVFEDGLTPTVDEAHAFLAGTFQRYPVAYVAGDGKRSARAAAYGGEGCVSALADHRSRALKVDWSSVSLVEQTAPEEVEVVGGPRGASVRLSFPDERSARSSANALELLRMACAAPPAPAQPALASRR